MPFFSVIIATRNRPALFGHALESVLAQSWSDSEIIVVNDGSATEYQPEYEAILGAVDSKRVRSFALTPRPKGHGQSYVLNFGAASAHGDYLCFLDDDDQWTDAEHLSRSAEVIAARAERTDLVLANQKAFRNGVPIEGVVWIEDLQDHLKGTPDATGAHTVTATELLLCQAHCHLNTTIVSRDFFLEIDGLDEGLRYECDRDFYLRAIDRARLIKFLPNNVSRHNIPDPAAGASMSTAESEMSKRLYQLRVLDKAILFTTRPELRRYAMRHRLYVLEHIAAEASRAGRADCATYYRREALLAKFALGWSDIIGRFVRRQRVSGLSARSK